jgi:hypothetical protein
LEINRDASALQAASPQLVVGIPVTLHDDYALRYAFQELAGAIMILVGVTMLVVSYCIRVIGRRRDHQVGRAADP